MTLTELYEQAKSRPSDINEHVEWLGDLAFECDHVTEFGSRTGVSTIGLLMGQPGTLITYDIAIQPEIMMIYKANKDFNPYLPLLDTPLEPGTIFIPHQASTLEIDPIEETDLLFIDTDHNYDQLIQELTIHGNKSRKWIAMHDTETYKLIGDPNTKAGLWPAIEEFLQMNPHWTIKEIRTNNNGMTLLERI